MAPAPHPYLDASPQRQAASGRFLHSLSTVAATVIGVPLVIGGIVCTVALTLGPLLNGF